MLTQVTRETTAQKIYHLAKELPKKEQDYFLSEIKKKFILLKAKELDKSIQKNKVSMEEIVKEVNVVRKKRYERDTLSNSY